MIKIKEYPSQEKLKELFEYRNGNLYWKKSVRANIFPGDIAGSFWPNGKKRIKLNGKEYPLHNLIYIYFNGFIDDDSKVTHQDNNYLNNSIENLKLISKYKSKIIKNRVNPNVNTLTQQEIKYLFEYKDGNLYWRNFPSVKSRIKLGSLAGNFYNRYYKITIGKKCYSTHRLIYIYFFGDISSDFEIDHIDNNPRNNNIENLRLATICQNRQNCKKSIKNSSGVKGISYNKKQNKWQATICANGEVVYREMFSDIKSAENAIRVFREVFHGKFCRHE